MGTEFRMDNGLLLLKAVRSFCLPIFEVFLEDILSLDLGKSIVAC